MIGDTRALNSNVSPMKLRSSRLMTLGGSTNRVCHKCASVCYAHPPFSSFFDSFRKRFRAGSVSGKLLSARLIRSSKCLKRTNGRLDGQSDTSCLLVTRPVAKCAPYSLDCLAFAPLVQSTLLEIQHSPGSFRKSLSDLSEVKLGMIPQVATVNIPPAPDRRLDACHSATCES
jgi:hypothetical protein